MFFCNERLRWCIHWALMENDSNFLSVPEMCVFVGETVLRHVLCYSHDEAHGRGCWIQVHNSFSLHLFQFSLASTRIESTSKQLVIARPQLPLAETFIRNQCSGSVTFWYGIDILLQIRILGSVPVTKGSGSLFGSDLQEKNSKFFCLLLLLGTFFYSSKIKIHKEVTKEKK